MIYDINGNPLYTETDGVHSVLDANNILSISNPGEIFTTFSAVYSAYDTLLENVGHEKNLLGYGTNSSGGQDTTLPIYEYYIKNPCNKTYSTNPSWSIRPAPKICLTSGLHGNERGAVVALFNCIKQIITGSDDVSESMRNSAEYRIVPVVNPGGFNDNTRDTRHGVNLNRNFGWNWGIGEHPGSAAYSEYESKALKAWCDEQAHDTLFMIDFHNHLASQTVAKDNIFYIFTDVNAWKNAFSVVYRGMRNHYLEESINLAEYGFVQQPNNTAGMANEFWKFYGVPSGGIETPNDPNNPSDNQWVKPSAEIQGTFINYMLHNYRFSAQ